jgi:signal transduction histidine kinase
MMQHKASDQKGEPVPAAPPANGFMEDYPHALKCYLHAPTEENLMQAYELARASLESSFSLSDYVTLHQETLLALPENLRSSPDFASNINTFVVEFISVYDMALQGYRRTIPRLRDEIEERLKVEAALRAATQTLAQERDHLDNKVEERTRELAEKAKTLESTLDRLLLTNREQAAFTYAISHDLKSPSNTILMLIDELQEAYGTILDADGNELLSLAKQTTSRMGKLVDDVLAYSRCIEDHSTSEVIDLVELVSDIIADLRFDIQSSNADLDIGPLPMVRGNRMQLKVLFQNLVSNAIKFRDPSKIPIVSISAVESADAATISISDNGIGIAQQHHERIFELFQRLHAYDAYGGSGIGLALCKRIASNHGSDLHLTSALGSGSTFSVTLEKAED